SRDGLQARRAEAVDGLRGDAVGQPGAEDHLPRDVQPLRAFRHGTAQLHVVDVLRRECAVHPAQQLADDLGHHVVGADAARRALLGAAYGGPHPFYNHCLTHWQFSPWLLTALSTVCVQGWLKSLNDTALW